MDDISMDDIFWTGPEPTIRWDHERHADQPDGFDLAPLDAVTTWHPVEASSLGHFCYPAGLAMVKTADGKVRGYYLGEVDFGSRQGDLKIYGVREGDELPFGFHFVAPVGILFGGHARHPTFRMVATMNANPAHVAVMGVLPGLSLAGLRSLLESGADVPSEVVLDVLRREGLGHV